MPRSPDYLGAVGIGVSDLQRSADFYINVLGMTQMQVIKLDHMDEIILVHENRTAVVLMHWTDGSPRNYKDVPVKLVFYYTDPRPSPTASRPPAWRSRATRKNSPASATPWSAWPRTPTGM